MITTQNHASSVQTVNFSTWTYTNADTHKQIIKQIPRQLQVWYFQVAQRTNGSTHTTKIFNKIQQWLTVQRLSLTLMGKVALSAQTSYHISTWKPSYVRIALKALSIMPFTMSVSRLKAILLRKSQHLKRWPLEFSPDLSIFCHFTFYQYYLNN